MHDLAMIIKASEIFRRISITVLFISGFKYCIPRYVKYTPSHRIIIFRKNKKLFNSPFFLIGRAYFDSFLSFNIPCT